MWVPGAAAALVRGPGRVGWLLLGLRSVSAGALAGAGRGLRFRECWAVRLLPGRGRAAGYRQPGSRSGSAVERL